MIGIFDSGLGGLFVLREMTRLMPNAGFVYAADCARAPYGGLSKDVLLEYASQLVEFLQNKGCNKIIVACGTVSSNCMDELRSKYSEIIFVDVITPLIKAILQHVKHSAHIGILATMATTQSGKLQRAIVAARPDVQICAVAAPGLVPLAEAGLHNAPEAKAAVCEYVAQLGHVDVIVLGCTHYPLFLEQIAACCGEAPIICPHTPTAEAAHETFACADGGGAVQVFASGCVRKFARGSRAILPFCADVVKMGDL